MQQRHVEYFPSKGKWNWFPSLLGEEESLKCCVYVYVHVRARALGAAVESTVQAIGCCP